MHTSFGGFVIRPLKEGFSIWASKSSLEARPGRDGILMHQEVSKQRARDMFEELASEVSKAHGCVSVR
jgi:hypothetical protein